VTSKFDLEVVQQLLASPVIRLDRNQPGMQPVTPVAPDVEQPRHARPTSSAWPTAASRLDADRQVVCEAFRRGMPEGLRDGNACTLVSVDLRFVLGLDE